MALDLLSMHPEAQRRLQGLLREARSAGIRVRVTSGFRSIRAQQRLYQAWLDRGRTGLPVALPGTSTHNYGLAIDLVVLSGRPTELSTFVSLAECWGLKWAGPSDPVHFDVFGPSAWRALLGGHEPTVTYRC